LSINKDMRKTSEFIHLELKGPKKEVSLINARLDYAFLKDKLNGIMESHVSIIRNEGGLRKAQGEMKGILNTLKETPEESVKYFELVNMAMVGGLIIEAALNRRKSLGAHYRIDDMEG